MFYFEQNPVGQYHRNIIIILRDSVKSQGENTVLNLKGENIVHCITFKNMIQFAAL